jgi:hypothetical protein
LFTVAGAIAQANATIGTDVSQYSKGALNTQQDVINAVDNAQAEASRQAGVIATQRGAVTVELKTLDQSVFDAGKPFDMTPPATGGVLNPEAGALRVYFPP